MNKYLLPTDMSLDAQGVVDIEVIRRMGGAARGAMAFRFNEIVHDATVAGIKQRHPDYDGEQVRKAYFRLRLGDEMMKTIWPNQALVDP